MNKEKLLIDLSQLLSVDKKILTDSFSLKEELNWDSLSIVSTVAAIDHHYNVSIKGTELMGCYLIGDVFSLLEKKLQNVTA